MNILNYRVVRSHTDSHLILEKDGLSLSQVAFDDDLYKSLERALSQTDISGEVQLINAVNESRSAVQYKTRTGKSVWYIDGGERFKLLERIVLKQNDWCDGLATALKMEFGIFSKDGSVPPDSVAHRRLQNLIHIYTLENGLSVIPEESKNGFLSKLVELRERYRFGEYIPSPN